MMTSDFDIDIFMTFSNLDPLDWILDFAMMSSMDEQIESYYITTDEDDPLTTSDGAYIKCLE